MTDMRRTKNDIRLLGLFLQDIREGCGRANFPWKEDLDSVRIAVLSTDTLCSFFGTHKQSVVEVGVSLVQSMEGVTANVPLRSEHDELLKLKHTVAYQSPRFCPISDGYQQLKIHVRQGL
jgi:hypothetical protein